MRNGGGPYTFRVHGKVYSLFNASAHPSDDVGQAKPRYAQLYVLDSSEATESRMQEASNAGTSRELMTLLDQIIRGCNPYADAYRMLREVEAEDALRIRDASGRTAETVPELKLLFRLNTSLDRRTYNAPVSNEVAQFSELPPTARSHLQIL